MTNKNEQYSDSDYIRGLMAMDERIVRHFFYKECYYLLNNIRYSLYNGKVCYDELVNELFLELSINNWKKLAGFTGANGCQLRSWTATVAWHYFLRKKDFLELKGFEEEVVTCSAECNFALEIEMRIDVQWVLSALCNPRYVDALKLLLVEGYSPKEVAAKWDTTVSNIYNIKHRAVERFLVVYGG